MDLALSDRSSRLSGPRLSGWIALSLLSHAVLLAAGVGTAPAGTPYLPALLTVDISHTVPEKQLATTVRTPLKTEQQRLSAPTHTSTEARRRAAFPETSGGPLPIDTYFQISELDVRAEPVNEVLLRYPWLEYRRRLAGVVRFTLYINAAGGLDKVDLIEATPPGHFEEAALEAVNKLQFSPARKNGRAVKSQKTIDVIFDPNEDFSKPVATRPEPSVAGK